MAYPESNFEVWLSDLEGGIIPDSYRVGHNIVTAFGKEWLRDLVTWATIDPLGVAADAETTEQRFRWISVGSGFQLEDEDVQRLVTAELITGSNFLKVLPVPVSPPPTTFAVKYVVVFPGGELPDPVNISEAGIFVDVDTGGGPVLDPTSANNIPVAYKSFPALPNKTVANTLTVTWEFRF